MDQGGRFDECYLNGAWSAEQQALHGGPIPCRGGAPLSRGVPELWPYARTEIASSQSMWANSWTTQPRQQTNWTNMDWIEFPKIEKARRAASSVPAVTPTDAYGGYLVGTLPREQRSDSATKSGSDKQEAYDTISTDPRGKEAES